MLYSNLCENWSQTDIKLEITAVAPYKNGGMRGSEYENCGKRAVNVENRICT